MKNLLFKLIIPVMAIALLMACEKDTFTNSLAQDRSGQVEARSSDYNFTTVLSGDNEVPPNESGATGVVIVKIAKDEMSIDYRLIVSNADSITASHFHLAPAGVNGPVVALLFGGPVTGAQDGVLAEGTITAEDVVGPLAGDLEALIDTIRSGSIYTNVHSREYPGGEIRGQLD